MRKEAPQVLLWSGLAAVLVVVAYLLINTTFMFYDDEGYVLLALRNYLEGHRLYDEVFSQYGPWPYVYHQLITSILQHPLTHTLGRMITLLHWVLAALLSGWLAQKLTGRTSMAVAAALSVFGLLWQMCSEPSHPGSMISMLVALAALGSTRLHEPHRATAAAGVIGALTALLCLTKINVGLLMAAGAGCAILRYTAWPERWRPLANFTAVTGLLALPWVLMANKLGDPWALIFATQFTLGAAGVLWVTPPAWSSRPLSPRATTTAGTSFLVAGLAVVAVVCWHGSSPSRILQAVLLTPLKQPVNFSFGFTWVSMVWPVAAASWLLTGIAGWEMRRRSAISRPVLGLLIAFRLSAFSVFALNASTWPTINGVGRFIVFCLPLLPVFLVPLRPHRPADGTNTRQSAVWCAVLIALPQVLHAFPVAGSQMGWGTFLYVPFLLAGLHEAWVGLHELAPLARRWLVPTGTAVLLAINGYQLWLLASNGWERYRTSRPLDLPGAEDIRPGGAARLALRTLTLNASIHADMLFSRPGMFSYNIWSGAITPTAQNATHWSWLLDHTAQNRIAARLMGSPRSAIITNRPLDEFLEKINVPTAGPLQDFIAAHYQPLFRIPDFTFLVPCGSRAVPFGIVERYEKAPGAPQGSEHLLLRANLALSGNPASIRAESVNYPWPVIRDYGMVHARAYVEPINSSGQPLGPALSLPTTVPLRGLYRLTIMEPQSAQCPGPGAVLVVADSKGQVLGEALF